MTASKELLKLFWFTNRNDFFNNFISRGNLFDDRITIVYNTSLNPVTEIYNRPENDPDDDPNDGGTTIYKQDVRHKKIAV